MDSPFKISFHKSGWQQRNSPMHQCGRDSIIRQVCPYGAPSNDTQSELKVKEKPPLRSLIDWAEIRVAGSAPSRSSSSGHSPTTIALSMPAADNEGSHEPRNVDAAPVFTAQGSGCCIRHGGKRSLVLQQSHPYGQSSGDLATNNMLSPENANQTHPPRKPSKRIAQSRGGNGMKKDALTANRDAELRSTCQYLSLYAAAPVSGHYTNFISFMLQRTGSATAPTDSATESLASQYFSFSFIAELCATATKVLLAEPTLLDLHLSKDDTVVVVGDIHGQFSDMYHSILRQQYDAEANPSRKDRRFLLLGDFVDRGPNSVDVMMLVLALKVEFPHLVFLTRGNHEEFHTSSVYGFRTEVECLLGNRGAMAWGKFLQVFSAIPLAAVVSTPHYKFFATHGGLSPSLGKDVNVIRSIVRSEYGQNMSPLHTDIVDGLLWSDPSCDVQEYGPNARGCGHLFSSRVSEAFCEQNDFAFVCRAHQVVRDGFLWTHNNRVVTVFSAPNYCGVSGNDGAVMIVDGVSDKPRFVQFGAARISSVGNIPLPQLSGTLAASFL